METVLALGNVDGMPVIVWNDKPRERCLVEADGKANPYEMMANLESASALMIGFEAFKLPPIGPLVPREMIVSPPTPVALLHAMGRKPTPASVRNATEAVSAWGASKAMPTCAQYFIPVEECVKMAHDLKVICSIYAYSIGECSFDMLKKNLAGGLYMTDCELEETDVLQNLYEAHLRKDASTMQLQNFPLFKEPKTKGMKKRLPEGTHLMLFEFAEDTIKRECSAFGRFAFNALMLDAAPCIKDDNTFSPQGGNGWGKAYAYFADALCGGKAAICDYCGNIFTRRRTTKRYCSNSCKVSASKAGMTTKTTKPAR